MPMSMSKIKKLQSDRSVVRPVESLFDQFDSPSVMMEYKSASRVLDFRSPEESSMLRVKKLKYSRVRNSSNISKLNEEFDTENQQALDELQS